jgi:hypothetical protein
MSKNFFLFMSWRGKIYAKGFYGCHNGETPVQSDEVS